MNGYWLIPLSMASVMLDGCFSGSERRENLSGTVYEAPRNAYDGNFRVIQIPVDDLHEVYQNIFLEIPMPKHLDPRQQNAYISGYCEYYSNRSGFPLFLGTKAEQDDYYRCYMDGLAAAKSSFKDIEAWFSNANQE